MISSETRKVGPFTGTGVATVFPFTFKVFHSSDLLVVRTLLSSGVESTLTLDTDYTVSLNADQDTNPGGNVTLLSVLAAGYTLIIASAVPNLQATELTNLGGFYPETLNDTHDKSTIQIQQLQEQLDRAIKLPISDPVLETELAIATSRAGKVLGFNAVTGAPEAVAAATGATGAAGAPGAAGGNGWVNTRTDASVPSGNSAGSGATANASLTTAMATYAGQTLMVPSASVHHITADLTITNQIEVGGGGGFYVDSGKVLTLNAARLPFTQCFWGPGTVRVMNRNILPQWYGAVGDSGVTDDAAAIQRAVTQNPGKPIKLVQTVVAGSGAATATPTSYRCASSITLSGNGQRIFGSTGQCRWLGSTKVKFDAGVTGFILPTTSANQGLEYLFIEGGDPFARLTRSSYADYSSLATVQTTGVDGIQCNGGEPWIKGVRVSSFKRHGIYTNGNSGGQPDFGRYSDIFVDTNGGYGIFIEGADGNVSLFDSIQSIGNCLSSFRDSSSFGAKVDMIHTSLNANAALAAGANINITSISVTSNVATIVMGSLHGWAPGDWVTFAPTDGTFAFTGKLLTASGVDATVNFVRANGSTGAGGTAALSSSVQIFAYYDANGVLTGSLVTNTKTSIDHFYEEGNQTTSNTGNAALCVGGVHSNGVGNWIYASTASINLRTKFLIWRPQDSASIFACRNVANDTNMFYADVSGNMTALGYASIGTGTIPNVGTIRMPNASSIYAKSQNGLVNLRGLYCHTDNNWYVGESTTVTHLQGTTTAVDAALTVATTAVITGQTTATGGIKVAAAGTTIKQITKITGVAVDLGSIAATSRGSTVVTVSGTPGIAAGDAIQVIGGINGFNDDLIFEGVEATGANQITCYFYNPTGAPIDDTSHNVDILWTDLT